MTEKFNENQKNNIQNSTLSKHALMNKNTFESLNKENKRKSRDEEINQNQFVFLNHKQEPKIFEFNYQKNTFNNIISEDLNVLKGKILLLITIELKNDFSANGVSLKKTLDCLITNFINLNKYNISNENIAIFIFFEEIHLNYNFFFNKEEKNEKKIFSSLMQYLNYDIYIFNTSFAFDIINLIFDKDKNLYLLKLKNGIRLKNTNTINLLLDYSLIKTEKKNSLIIPLIETESLNENTENIFTQFENYENFLYNIYDLNYFDFSISIPENNYVTFYSINKKNIDKFIQFYSSIFFNDYINNHSLSIYIKTSNLNVIFANDIICYKNRNLITFSQMKNNYIFKKSNDFLSFNDLKENFSEIPFFKKIIIIHRFIGIIFSFLFPSFSTMFIFCIFAEAFNSYNTDAAFFFSLINLFLIILIILTNNIKKEDEEELNNEDNNEYQTNIDEMNTIYFFIFDFYYIFILICSIPSLYFIDHNKPISNYKFNKGMCISLILINFFISLIPIIFYIKTYSNKIIKSLKYLFLASPGYNSFLNILSIINAYKNYYSKSIFVLIFCIFNGFIFIFGFCLNNRKRRIHFVETISIIFTIYNGIKIICIIINHIFNESENEEEEEENSQEKKNNDVKNNKSNDFKIEMAKPNNNFNDKFSEDDEQDNNNKKNNPIREQDISINFENGDKK